MHFGLAQVLIVLAALGLTGSQGFAQSSNSAPLRTNFFRGPALTAQEIEMVAKLAQQCGLEEPESLADVRILPDLKSVPRSMVVTSTERVEGRKASRYYVRVDCTNWSLASLGYGAKQLGKFYVNPPYLKTNELSLVKFGTNIVRLSVAKDIPLHVADAIGGCFARREYQFSSPQVRSDWALVNLSDPAALSKDSGTDGYRIYFGSPLRQAIYFKFINEHLVFTYIPGEIIY